MNQYAKNDKPAEPGAQPGTGGLWSTAYRRARKLNAG